MARTARKSHTNPTPAPVVEVPAAPQPSTKRTIQRDRVTQNGITRPSTGGKCELVWAECDRLLAAGTNPTVAHLRSWCEAGNHNVNNAQIELYRWRTWAGVASTRAPAKVQVPATP